MAEAKQLPFLIKLLDDDSATVREQIRSQLQAFGPELLELCHQQGIELTPDQRRILGSIMRVNEREVFQQLWLAWLHEKKSESTLHTAMELVANYIGAHETRQNLDSVLDDLVRSFKAAYPDSHSPLDLAKFLFADCGFSGNRNDYYLPENSSLLFVYESKVGIPISLCCLYILTGQKLGMNVQGCNFPRHFLARATYKNKSYLIDAFEGGRHFPDEIFFNPKDSQFRAVVSGAQLVPSPKLIGLRTLNNLSLAFKAQEQDDEADFFSALAKQTQDYLEENEL